MKITLNPWALVFLLLALLLVASSLCATWRRLNHEVSQAAALTLPISTSLPLSQDKKSPVDTASDTPPDLPSLSQITPVTILSASRAPVSPYPIQSVAGISAALSLSVSPYPSDTSQGASSASLGIASRSGVASSPRASSSGFVENSVPVMVGSFASAGVGLPVAGSQGGILSAPAGVSVPAAFGNPSALGNSVSPTQQAAIAQIASDFTAAVQSSGAAPNSPEYKQAWNTAAFRADEAFRGKFGTPAFNAMQISRGYQP